MNIQCLKNCTVYVYITCYDNGCLNHFQPWDIKRTGTYKTLLIAYDDKIVKAAKVELTVLGIYQK